MRSGGNLSGLAWLVATTVALGGNRWVRGPSACFEWAAPTPAGWAEDECYRRTARAELVRPRDRTPTGPSAGMPVIGGIECRADEPCG